MRRCLAQRGGAQPNGKRGFALTVVLALLLIASLTLGAAIQRQASQRLAVERALLQYRRHHEAFGVRAVVKKWLVRMGSNRRLQSLTESADERPVFHFEMPGGTELDVFARDGQGTMLEDIDGLVAGEFELYAEILGRIPLERVDLVRTVGPMQMSLASVPADVLAALVPEEERRSGFVSAALTARERDRLTPSELATLLRRRGGVGEEAERIASLFTLSPTLWELRVEARDELGERVFEAFVEMVDGDPVVRRWTELLPGADALEADASGASGDEG